MAMQIADAGIHFFDGDEAFDDGSYVLHIDDKEMARVIAFQSTGKEFYDCPGTLREIVIPEDEFYGVLSRWVVALDDEIGSHSPSTF